LHEYQSLQNAGCFHTLHYLHLLRLNTLRQNRFGQNCTQAITGKRVSAAVKTHGGYAVL